MLLQREYYGIAKAFAAWVLCSMDDLQRGYFCACT
jgi:hypothetical protein